MLSDFKNHLVVQSAAEKGMRVGNYSGVPGVRSSGIEQSFEAAHRAVERYRANCTGLRFHGAIKHSSESELPRVLRVLNDENSTTEDTEETE